MSRMTDLLESAADEFARGASPFRPEWLTEHAVTFGECQELSDQIASACRNWARLDVEERLTGIARVVGGGRGDSGTLAARMGEGQGMPAPEPKGSNKGRRA